ncbi:hypothetical protein VTK56DRAFT_3603 [Thermocarpiscus australiensis]
MSTAEGALFTHSKQHNLTVGFVCVALLCKMRQFGTKFETRELPDLLLVTSEANIHHLDEAGVRLRMHIGQIRRSAALHLHEGREYLPDALSIKESEKVKRLGPIIALLVPRLVQIHEAGRDSGLLVGHASRTWNLIRQPGRVGRMFLRPGDRQLHCRSSRLATDIAASIMTNGLVSTCSKCQKLLRVLTTLHMRVWSK